MKKLKILTLIAVLCFFYSVGSYAKNSNNLYVVKYGDTLWDLSKKHYDDPFLWGKIWINNTYINDPNLIFPGEIIQFTKHGITIYKKPKIIAKKKIEKKTLLVTYDSPVYFDGRKYYSDCGGGFCVWNKDAFNVGKISFDRYNNIEVKAGDTVYITTKKTMGCCKKFYVYRQMKDYLSNSLCPNEPKDMYYPIGEIKIEKMVKPNIYKGKVVKASEEISENDVVSVVYPYKKIKANPTKAILCKLPIELLSIHDDSLSGHIGLYMFVRVPKAHWQIKKRRCAKGYHITKEPKPLLTNIVGYKVMVDRVNHNIPENTNIGEGVVVSQYKNYMTIFFDTYNSNLKEIMDRTQEYVLR